MTSTTGPAYLLRPWPSHVSSPWITAPSSRTSTSLQALPSASSTPRSLPPLSRTAPPHRSPSSKFPHCRLSISPLLAANRPSTSASSSSTFVPILDSIAFSVVSSHPYLILQYASYNDARACADHLHGQTSLMNCDACKLPYGIADIYASKRELSNMRRRRSVMNSREDVEPVEERYREGLDIWEDDHKKAYKLISYA